MTFKLPPLPYAYDALAPHMSVETLQFHHDKHHQAYVDNGNKFAGPGTKYEGKSIDDICKEAFAAKDAPVVNNIGQHYNHINFWQWMRKGGGGKKLPAKLQAMVDKDCGGFDKMRADFVQAGVSQFGSGWAWLAVKGGKLRGDQDRQRREPADVRRTADPGRRRVGAQLLHRLPQRAAEVPRGLVRQPGELGARRDHARQSDVGANPTALTGSDPLPRRQRQARTVEARGLTPFSHHRCSASRSTLMVLRKQVRRCWLVSRHCCSRSRKRSCVR